MTTTDTRAGLAAPDPSHRPREGSLPRRIVTAILVGLVIAYQRVVSPWLPDTCRFEPSCSQYARDALVAHGPFRGLWLATRRIARCHPLGGQGYDPVPPRAGSDDVRTVVES